MSDLGLISKSVSDILGFEATAAEDTATAKAQGFAQQGYTAEQGAYTTAGSIAQNSAALEQVAGTIQQYQAARQAAQAIGAEQADVGAAGFGMSGSNLAALKSSYQQSYLTDQLIRTQTGINQGGYLEQAAAAGGEAAAAGAAGSAAGVLGTAASTAAGVASTNAANETSALMGFVANSGVKVSVQGGPLAGETGTVGGISGTPAGNLITATLSGNQQLPASWSTNFGSFGGNESQFPGTALSSTPGEGAIGNGLMTGEATATGLMAARTEGRL